MGAIEAAFALISSSMHNNEFADAVLYASTLWEIINHKHDNKIPDDVRPPYIARGAYHLAEATLQLAMAGGIPLGEKRKKAGQETIALARRALEIHTQWYESENGEIANDMAVLAEALDHFNDCDDEEVLRLFEQAKAINARVYGGLSASVARGESKMGGVCYKRAERALQLANDLDRFLANMKLALPHFRESARINRAIGLVDMANQTAQLITQVEKRLQDVVAASKG